MNETIYFLTDIIRCKASHEEIAKYLLDGSLHPAIPKVSRHGYDHARLRTIANFFIARTLNFYLDNETRVIDVGSKME